MAKKMKRAKPKKITGKPKKVIKAKTKKKRAAVEREQTKKVNWAALPGEEPTEEEYLDEDYPENEGFGTEEGEANPAKPTEDDYEKVPEEQETVEEEET